MKMNTKLNVSSRTLPITLESVTMEYTTKHACGVAAELCNDNGVAERIATARG